MNRRLVHALTPGDHFSPRTGSAIPTIVDGLSRNSPLDRPRPAVLVATGTYPDRYPSAEVIEYQAAAARRSDRYVDAALARLGAGRPSSTRALGAVLRAQAGWDPSIVLAHNAPSMVRLVDPPHLPVLYAHNQVLGTYSSREAARTLDRAAAIVSVSDFLADQLAARLPARLHGRVCTVHNGVDAAAFDVPRLPRSETLRVAFVGRVIADKGVHVLLEAVRLLSRPDIEVTVIGRPGFDPYAPLTTYEQRLRRQATDIAGAVCFSSFVPRTDLPSALAQADVVAVPSIWPEPFGLTALEGMAAGAAVIASAVGGIPEAVGDAGKLVPPGDAASLAEAIEFFATDENALASASARSKEHALSSSWARTAESLEHHLRRLG